MKKLVIMVLAILLIGCDNVSVGGKVYYEDHRFEVVEEFRAFEHSYRKNSKVIRDKETGKCYLWLRYGSGNGGVGVVETPCT